MYFGENCRWVPLIITVISAQFPGVTERRLYRADLLSGGSHIG